MQKTKFKTNHHYYPSNSTDFSKSPSMVQTQFAEEGDINNIMAKYAKTGILPTNDRQAQYLDLSENNNFTAMQDKVLHMNTLFNELPSEIRDEFRTPTAFYEAFGTKTGLARLESLGVLSKNESPVTMTGDAGLGVQSQTPAQDGLLEPSKGKSKTADKANAP